MSYEIFINPPKKYRGIPFWSLNDVLEDDELRRQIKEMDENGFGGFFMHAREGLITPYLSDEWMNKIKICIEEAKKRGMGAWIYDEDRWPSGFAGGIIPAISSRFRAQGLILWMNKRLDRIVGDTIKVFVGRIVDDKIVEVMPVEERNKIKGDKIYLYFIRYIAPVGDQWYGCYCYIDTLNPNIVKAFIESTYEKYYELFKEYFGKTVPGVFTDEPNFISSRSPPGRRPATWLLPWTSNLPEIFEKNNGYNILDHLPSLFLDIGDYKKIRYDFWKTITHLFLESYTKQIYEWCDKHGLKYTGHYLAEDTLLSQLKCIGSAMIHYEYMHIPGIDHLGRNIKNTVTVKQVASVANQLGKERVLCEVYGGSGQNLSFEDRKWIGDWLYVLGINLLNHHLLLYSMRGRRKRDFPPNLFYQQPWWKYNNLIEKYFTRLSYILSQGIRIASILVIHPIRGAWSLYTPLNDLRVRQLDEYFKWLTYFLLDNKLDFEYGDENIIARHGSVDKKNFIVGRCKYNVVLIPPTTTISEKTYILLKKFAENKGKIIFIKPLPDRIDGKIDNRINSLIKSSMVIDIFDEEKLLNTIDKKCRIIKIIDENNKNIPKIWYHLRKLDDKYVLFMANLDRDRKYNATIMLRFKGFIEEWDPFTGSRKNISAIYRDGYTVFNLTFYESDSHLIVINPNRNPLKMLMDEEKVKEIPLGNIWGIERLNPNSITLDYCKLSLNRREFGERIPTWMAQKIVMKNIGSKFVVRYEFNVDRTILGNKIYLVVENPEKFIIRINNNIISGNEGYWIDKSFRKINISKHIVGGENIVELEGEITIYTEIESIYVIGDFAVKRISDGGFILTAEKTMVNVENLTEEGYMFYAGKILLKKKFNLDTDNRVFLEIDELNAIIAEIYINNMHVGEIFKHPYRLEITNYIKRGENEINIILVNSLRNLLGPHHHKSKEPLSVGPKTFEDILNWTDKYYFVPFGIKNARIIIRA